MFLPLRRLHGDDTTGADLAKGKTDTVRLDLCPGRSTVRGSSLRRPQGAILARSTAGASGTPPEDLPRAVAGGRLWRLQSAVQGRSRSNPLNRRFVGHTRVAGSSCSQTLMRTRQRGRTPRRSRLWPRSHVKRIDGLFDIEREISRLTADQRLEHRATRKACRSSTVAVWLQTERAKLSRSSPGRRALITYSSDGTASRHSWRMAGFASRTTP